MYSHTYLLENHRLINFPYLGKTSLSLEVIEKLIIALMALRTLKLQRTSNVLTLDRGQKSQIYVITHVTHY